MIPVQSVGLCSDCGGRIMLQMEKGRRSASCPCGRSRIPESFFAANGMGDAARTSNRERIMAARTVGNGRTLDVLDGLIQESAIRNPWRDDEGERLVGL